MAPKAEVVRPVGLTPPPTLALLDALPVLPDGPVAQPLDLLRAEVTALYKNKLLLVLLLFVVAHASGAGIWAHHGVRCYVLARARQLGPADRSPRSGGACRSRSLSPCSSVFGVRR